MMSFFWLRGVSHRVNINLPLFCGVGAEGVWGVVLLGSWDGLITFLGKVATPY